MNTYIKVWEMLLERRVQFNEHEMVQSVMWFESMLGRNPWTNMNSSAYHLFLCIWKHFNLREFHNKIHMLLREMKTFLCSHFTLCQLRPQKSEAEKTLERKGQESKRFGERVEWRRCLHLTVLPQSQFPSGSFLGSGWSGLSMSAQAFHQGVLHPRLMAQSPESTCSPGSLSSHWSFLPLSSRRKSYVIHVPGFVLPLCSTFQNFPLWLILTGSPLSIHPHFMARYSTRNGKENFLGLLADPPRFTLVHLKSGPFSLHLHSMSSFWSFVSPESALFIITLLASEMI